MGPEHRLAVYGTLAPGEVNHDQLADIAGRWFDGAVRGHLHAEGWGATLGFPAVVLDTEGPEVRVRVFESSDLPDHWERLDRFEGPGYRRIEIEMWDESSASLGTAWIYQALNPDPI